MVDVSDVLVEVLLEEHPTIVKVRAKAMAITKAILDLDISDSLP